MARVWLAMEIRHLIHHTEQTELNFSLALLTAESEKKFLNANAERKRTYQTHTHTRSLSHTHVARVRGWARFRWRAGELSCVSNWVEIDVKRSVLCQICLFSLIFSTFINFWDFLGLFWAFLGIITHFYIFKSIFQEFSCYQFNQEIPSEIYLPPACFR